MVYQLLNLKNRIKILQFRFFFLSQKNYKGFYKIPKIIKILQKKYSKKIKFIIQVSKKNKEIHSTYLKLKKIASLNKNVKIIEGSIDNLEFEKYLSLLIFDH